MPDENGCEPVPGFNSRKLAIAMVEEGDRQAAGGNIVSPNFYIAGALFSLLAVVEEVVAEVRAARDADLEPAPAAE